MNKKLLVAALSMLLLSWPKTGAAACSTFGGRATVVQANGLGVGNVVVSDTGNLDSTGGAKQASLLNLSIPGLLLGDVLHATAVGEGSSSQSEASAVFNVTLAGNTIGTGFVMARANAYCGGAGATVSGSTEIDGLVVNGHRIRVTGSPNQTLSLPGGVRIILNEQTSSVQGQSGSITVNALHIKVPGIIDAVIASASALAGGGGSNPAITSPFSVMILPLLGTRNPPCADFVTGGGWIIDKGTFGVGGGFKPDGTPWGHLEYQDHGAGMNVHGTGVTNCGVTGPNSRQITGTAEVNSQSGDTCGPFTYAVDVADNGEPGIGVDTFALAVSDGCVVVYSGGEPAGSTTLSGGNIQLHE